MIFVIRLVTGHRRLLRKRMYKAPHKRQKGAYFRENKNQNKYYQDEFKNMEKIYKKRRPKREAISGFKMAYRYKYYDIIEEEDL